MHSRFRSKISKDKFRYEYANRQSLRIDRLSPEILNEFDLFFIDQESLDALSNNDKAALEESVKQGLGLLTFYHSKDKIRNSAFLSLSMREIVGRYSSFEFRFFCLYIFNTATSGD